MKIFIIISLPEAQSEAHCAQVTHIHLSQLATLPSATPSSRLVAHTLPSGRAAACLVVMALWRDGHGPFI